MALLAPYIFSLKKSSVFDQFFSGLRAKNLVLWNEVFLSNLTGLVYHSVKRVFLLPVMNVPLWLWIWIAVIAIVKFTNTVMGFIRRKELVDYHTFLNKTTGLLLFLLPFTLQLIEPTHSFAVVCTIATIAALGEGYYIIKVNDK